MKLAYLVNQYPHVSHTFIRREIAALESLGLCIDRFTIRPSPDKLVDPIDQEEQRRTLVILRAGSVNLLIALALAAVPHPLKFLRAIATTWRLGGRSGRRFRAFAYLIEAAWLARRLAQLGVDHLHAHFGTNSAAVALLCRELGGPPYSFTVHGPEEFDRPMALSLTEKIYGAAFVVAISDFGRSQLFRWCDSTQWEKIHVVRCGLDAQFLGRNSTDPNTSRRFVCVGRLCEQKGQLILVAAVAQLKAEFPDLQIVLVGDGPMRREIETEIDTQGLQNIVRITGWMSGEAVRTEIESSRAFILPSFAEGLPVVLMEALALCRPAVSTYVAGIPELIQDRETGCLVPAGSVPKLTEAMRWMLSRSEDELRQMGEKGREIVHRRHDAVKEAAQLRKLVEASSLGQSSA